MPSQVTVVGQFHYHSSVRTSQFAHRKMLPLFVIGRNLIRQLYRARISLCQLSCGCHVGAGLRSAALGGAGESQPGLGRDSESCDNSGRERAKFAASGQPQR